MPPIFFGRDRLIAELVDTLKSLLTEQQPDTNPGRLLALIGASGSGKSSVVMAGLLPQLEREVLPDSEQWVYLEPMRPGEHPLEALALTLAPYFPQRSVTSLHEELNDESARGLHRLASCLVRMPQQKVVLLIDQFEEVFTHTTSEWEREGFIDLLVSALTQSQGPIIVLLTLRADFYDRPMSYPTLYQLIETHHKAVLPMDLADLRTVIKEPAALPDVQLTFEETLVGDLLFEMQGQVGALPLLQFTLDQLFQRRSGSLLTLQAYQEMGGVKGALVKQAESTYAALHSEEHRRLARVLFLRLIDPGMGEQDTTRRRVSLVELSLADSKQTVLLQEVADTFITARLLTANEVAGAATIEVSHEALIREWPRLLDWLREGREDIDLQQAVSQDVAEWEQRGKPEDRLYRGSQLKEARAWAKRNIPSRNEVAFLHASVASRMRFLVSMIAVLLIIVSSIGAASWVLTHQSPDPTFVSNLQDNDEPGSLRHAIDAALPKSTITFSASLRGTILLTSGNLTIAKDLIIHGPGKGLLSISSGTSRHSIRVIQGVTVTIFGLTFKDSNNSTSVTGFIDNQGTLTMSNSTVSGNTASSSGGTYDTNGTLTLSNSSGGGGISNFGTLTLSNSTVSGNRAIGGGGIGNFGTLTLSNSTVSGNTADVFGSGIYNTGTLILNNSTVSGNTTDGEGGGISNFGTLTLSNSTVLDNTASSGGGIDNQGTFTTTTNMNIINSTISGNKASNVGGGILIQSSIQSNNLFTIVEGLIKANLTFSTIYGNTAHRGGDIAIEDLAFSPNGGNGKPSKQVSQVKIRNSIIAGDPTHLDSDIVGMFTSYGYNLFQDDSGATFDPATRTQHGTDKILSVNDLPKLFADPVRLQDNGGPTRTYALAPGSPAIDKIPLAACLVNGITTDQRGVKRPQGAKCDIGAYEYAAAG
jgi:energy-coupling factor transporter ATP-binding protein EcfA2